MAEQQTITVNLRGFPRDLHRQLRVAAAKQGVSLKAVMIEAARLWLRTKGGK